MNVEARFAKRITVIPMKDPSKAKTRLATALPPEQRQRLAVALFRATIAKLQNALSYLPEGTSDIAVVSHSSVIAGIAKKSGLIFIDDKNADTLSLAVDEAANWANRQGYTALCVVPSDLAAPSRKDLTRLLTYPLSNESAVFCPSQDLGTNALLTPLPCPFPFRYGPRSLIAHRQAAESSGLCPRVLQLSSLQVDVDTIDDLNHLLAQSPEAFAKGGVKLI